MEALGYKEEAQRLQALGIYDEALPLMLRSVRLCENSHTLCLSLSELAELYLDMLKHGRRRASYADGGTSVRHEAAAGHRDGNSQRRG